MKFEVFCDESSLEALTRRDAHNYAAIGSIWIPADKRKLLKAGINEIKARHKIFGELKWKKVSPSTSSIYKDVIDYFFKSEYIRFRVILVESQKVDHFRFNQEDAELGFYKFYYQMIHHWIFDFNVYQIFVDFKVNKNTKRLHVLKDILNNSNITSKIDAIQALHSEQSAGIQLADILTGLVCSKFNDEIKKENSGKSFLINYVESSYLKRPISPTPKWEEKFNIFKINLQGGW